MESFEKDLRGRGEHGVLFPDQKQLGMERRRQGPEAQRTVCAGIHQLVKGEHTPQSLPRQNTAVVGQVVGRRDVQPVHLLPEPVGQLLLQALAGTNQRHIQKVVRGKRLLLRQGVVPPQDHAPGVRAGQGQMVVFGQVIGLHQNGEDPVWTGSEELAVDATRAEAAVALYETFREPESTPTSRPSGGGSSSSGSSRPSGGGSGTTTPMPTPDPEPEPTPAPTPEPDPEPNPAPEGGKVLVAYFSATGNTRPVAEKVAEAAGGDLFEIVSAQPYTSADLNYNTDCRANAEQNDPTARPAIQNAVEDMDRYDAVLIGYPIWWGRAPKIIHTFLETYDLSGKTVATFCTSGGSGHEDATLRGYEPDATWLEGRRFSGTSQVEEWVNGLDLPKPTDEEANKMYLQIGDTVWTATLEDNLSVTAFKELLSQGPVTVNMSDYGGFEKVGGLATTLPQSNRQITTKPGDIILYQGNSVTIYYGENSWNFTLLGHVDGVTDAQLREVLKAGGEDILVTFSLEE